MTDTVLFVLVLGALLLVLAVDIAAALGWLRRLSR